MRFIGTMNKVRLIGTLEGPIVLSHMLFGQRFYKATLVVKRESKVKDYIPLTISERWKIVMENAERVNIIGVLRCYNVTQNDKPHMGITVFVKSCVLEPEDTPDMNDVCLFGKLHKQPILKERRTKKLAQFLLVVYRDKKHPDVIPCMTWNQNAELTVQLAAETNVTVHGRIQSRLIKNKTETTYEVSVNHLDVYDQH